VVTGLQIAWGIALIVVLGALPMGLLRAVAYRSGEVDHTRTMLIAATVALGLGLAGLVCLLVLSVLLFG
jgi:hypothetical protein